MFWGTKPDVSGTWACRRRGADQVKERLRVCGADDLLIVVGPFIAQRDPLRKRSRAPQAGSRPARRAIAQVPAA